MTSRCMTSWHLLAVIATITAFTCYPPARAVAGDKTKLPAAADPDDAAKKESLVKRKLDYLQVRKYMLGFVLDVGDDRLTFLRTQEDEATGQWTLSRRTIMYDRSIALADEINEMADFRYSYGKAELKPGDYVNLVTIQDMSIPLIITEIRILRRPGGEVPPSRKAGSSLPDYPAYHVEQAWKNYDYDVKQPYIEYLKEKVPALKLLECKYAERYLTPSKFGLGAPSMPSTTRPKK